MLFCYNLLFYVHQCAFIDENAGTWSFHILIDVMDEWSMMLNELGTRRQPACFPPSNFYKDTFDL